MSALEPKLTVYDRRVLLAVPEGGDVEKRLREGGPSRTAWQIAEALETFDVDDVASMLRSLEHFRYVASTFSRGRGRTVWWRTQRGDEVL